jgi:hypothetical protein
MNIDGEGYWREKRGAPETGDAAREQLAACSLQRVACSLILYRETCAA